MMKKMPMKTTQGFDNDDDIDDGDRGGNYDDLQKITRPSDVVAIVGKWDSERLSNCLQSRKVNHTFNLFFAVYSLSILSVI